ncbi:hypothetical protein, partial [Lacticaseibacillus rhamnosus]|uniref:hypothetical protein n=1 Tax=Lacticaseibacillus rhamnosus TaxID=47715 RepID=UPI001CDBBB0B
ITRSPAQGPAFKDHGRKWQQPANTPHAAYKPVPETARARVTKKTAPPKPPKHPYQKPPARAYPKKIPNHSSLNINHKNHNLFLKKEKNNEPSG